MAVVSTLQMIRTIPKFDGQNYAEWTRKFLDVTSLAWACIYSIATGLERPQPEYEEDVLDCEEADDLPESHNYKDIISGKLITNNSLVSCD